MDSIAFVGAVRPREETPVLSKNKESHFEKSGPHPAADVSTLVLAVAPDTAPCPCGLGYSPIWLGFYHRHHTSSTNTRCVLENRNTDLSPSCRP